MSTLRVVYVVCAYICCLHVAADVLGTSQECDDEVCLLQNLVRKPSVLPAESGQELEETNFLQLRSHIDNALKEAAEEALKDLGSYCKWTELSGSSTKYFFKFSASGNAVANRGQADKLDDACKNAVLIKMKDTNAVDETPTKCAAKCDANSFVYGEDTGSTKHQCLAVAAIWSGSAVAKKSGCWALVAKNQYVFPTLKAGDVGNCFAAWQDTWKIGTPVFKQTAGKPKVLSCTPSLELLATMVNGLTTGAAKSAKTQFAKINGYLDAASGGKKGTLEGGKITFENGDIVFNVVGLGVTDIVANKKAALLEKIKIYIESLVGTSGLNGNVAVVKVSS